MAKNNDIFLFEAQDSLPQSAAGTGTISDGSHPQDIIGVGTSFTTEIERGEFIYITGQNDFRRVVSVESDTQLTLDSGFGTPLSGDSFRITPRPQMRHVSIKAVGGTITVDGISIASGDEINYPMSGSMAKGRLDPIDIAPGANDARVQVIY
jgi:hypothetical protein